MGASITSGCIGPGPHERFKRLESATLLVVDCHHRLGQNLAFAF